MMYKSILKPLLFKMDAEKAHHFTLKNSGRILRFPGGEKMLKAFAGNTVSDPYDTLGLNFRNRVGLAAGMDKDAQFIEVWDALGFGFVEIGTVTPLPQAGNPKPRLFRLPKDKALINRMGFNNQGLDIMCKRLEKYDRSNLIVGGNIGKNKVTPNDEAWKDYVKCFVQLQDLVDYFAINVSSPNTPGLRELQEKEPLLKILSKVQNENIKRSSKKPILLKIAPDVNEAVLQDILTVVEESDIDGMILNNTTIDRSGLKTSANTIAEIGNGGLSGAPLRIRSNDLLKQARHSLGDKKCIVGVGGIMDVQSAIERIESGADLVQVYSGLIYGGPDLVQSIAKGIAVK